MKSSSDNKLDFEKVLVDGIRNLLEEIKRSLASGRLPLVVTISRRMPHLLLWYEKCVATEDEKRFIESIEIITEIALPFIDFRDEQKKRDIFLVDDMINTGRTFMYIKELTEAISGNPVKKSFVMFARESAMHQELRDDASCQFNFVFQDYLYEKVCDLIATLIAVTLPIDVTYPLLYFVDEPSDFVFDDFKMSFRDPRSQDMENYDVSVTYRYPLTVGLEKKVRPGNFGISYTSLLPSELSGSLNNDFAKIRCYMRLGEFVVVPYAPNILSDSQLINPDLFEASQYMKVWNMALNAVDEQYLRSYDWIDENAEKKELIGNRTRRSLVCMANYLYSLSSFNRILNCNVPASAYNYRLRQRDVVLILGRELAERAIRYMDVIVAERLVSPRVHQKIRAPYTLIPELHDEEYTISKYMCVMGDDLTKDLISIFENARLKRDRFLPVFIEDKEYEVEGIMESFESLEKALLVKDLQKTVEIYKWIDAKIDGCVIVSRYAPVTDEDGDRYWRRFFRITSMA